MAAVQTQTYVYKGRDKNGRPVNGEITGNTPIQVKAQLRRQGIVPGAVRRKSKPLLGRAKPVNPADIALFTRQLATMMKAGVPLVQSFTLIIDSSAKPKFKDLITDIHTHVTAGNSFGSALRRHPQYFDNLMCSLVEAGEQAGALDVLLERIANYKEKTERLKAKIKKALTYPTAVVAVAIVVTGILLVKVVPVFAETYNNFGAELPAFTRLVVSLSELAQTWWLPLLLLVFGAIAGIRQGRLKSPAFSAAIDRYLLRVPIIGKILTNAVIARFARTLSTTFAAGVPLMDALQSVAGAAGNALYRDAILRVRDDVATGRSIHDSLKMAGVFPIMLLQLTAIGEESGALDDLMERAAEHYELAVDDAVDNLTALLEPLIMSVLGVLVGGLLIAMYLPIFNLGQVI